MARGQLWILSLAFLWLFHGSAHSREFIELSTSGGRAPGVVYLVQLSDLHISSFYPNRSQDLKKLAAPLLRLISPSVVLITGDLTDGKSKNRALMRQDESEWIQYKETMDWVINYTGLPEHVFFDTRGNHDKFGVPRVGGELDYYYKYSINARQNRTSTVQSVTLLDGEWKHLIVGVDNSMEVGLRGPCNLFGHVTDERLEILNSELSQWDKSALSKVTKLVYGHFPSSFISSTQNGRRPEELFAKHNISAYVCGHLHYQFGKNLIKHNIRSFSDASGEFWEWEVGDWRENRVMRVLAIDHGHTSFLDLNLSFLGAAESKSFVFITYPLDSRKMQRKLPMSLSQYSDSVRALVFFEQPITTVKAQIYDSNADLLIPIEEVVMEHQWKESNSVQYFVASLNMTRYVDPSPIRYCVRVVANDTTGREITSFLRPFSVSDHVMPIDWNWKEFFVMGIIWDALYKPLVWASFFMLSFFLTLQKIAYYLLKRKYVGERQSRSKCGITSWTGLREVFIEACKMSSILWWVQLTLLLYLMGMPWFWGMVFGENYPAGSMSIGGWSVKLSGDTVQKAGLGVPDVMVIVLPYMYEILIPVYIIVFCLFFELSLVQVHARTQSGRPPNQNLTAFEKHCLGCKLFERWLRVALLLACLGISLLHAHHIKALVGAYGWKVILISPGFAWPVPFLLGSAILQTSNLKIFKTYKQRKYKGKVQ